MEEHVELEEEQYYQLIAAQLEGDSLTRKEELEVGSIASVGDRRTRTSRKSTQYRDYVQYSDDSQ